MQPLQTQMPGSQHVRPAGQPPPVPQTPPEHVPATQRRKSSQELPFVLRPHGSGVIVVVGVHVPAVQR